MKAALGVIVCILVAGAAYMLLSDGAEQSALPTPSSPVPTSSSPSPAVSEPDTVLQAVDPLRMDGIGPATVGMSVEEVEQVSGERIRVFSDFGPRCRYSQPHDGTPRGLLFMLSHRKVVRIDVDRPSKIETVSGIAIGDTQAKVLRAYGDSITIEPHPYLMDRGKYLVHQPDDGGLLLIFETDRGKVTSFRSGYDEQVRYIEGCA